MTNLLLFTFLNLLPLKFICWCAPSHSFSLQATVRNQSMELINLVLGTTVAMLLFVTTDFFQENVLLFCNTDATLLMLLTAQWLMMEWKYTVFFLTQPPHYLVLLKSRLYCTKKSGLFCDFFFPPLFWPVAHSVLK